MYLYGAVDSEGNTIDFYLSKKRDTKAAKTFFQKVLATCHGTIPRVINGDKAYPPAIRELKQENSLPSSILLRVKQYLNNMIAGLEAMYMIKKEQIHLQDQSVQNQNIFIHQLFGLTI